MKKIILFVSVLFLVCIVNACEDEFIDSAENKMNRELNNTNSSLEEIDDTTARGDSVNNNDWNEEPKYPIGFGITVSDYDEIDLDYVIKK